MPFFPWWINFVNKFHVFIFDFRNAADFCILILYLAT